MKRRILHIIIIACIGLILAALAGLELVAMTEMEIRIVCFVAGMVAMGLWIVVIEAVKEIDDDKENKP